MQEIIIEIRTVVDQFILNISSKFKKIEYILMEFIQFYIDFNDLSIRNSLELRRRNLEDLKNLINVYRIPPIILKEKQNEVNLIVQIKVILFYFELISIEIEKIHEDFIEGLDKISDEQYVRFILSEFSHTFFHIKNLFLHLEEFGNQTEYENVFDVILPKIKKIYSDQDELEKIIKLAENINFNEFEALIIQKNQVSSKYSVVLKILNKISLNSSHRKKLIDIINLIIESDDTKQFGGVISINKLFNLISKRDQNLEFSLLDLKNTLKYMKNKGYISEIEKLSNSIIITLYPLELSEDPHLLLDAVEEEGVETKESLLKKLNWSEIRLNAVIDFLIQKGICRIGENSMTGMKLYFPGIK